MITRSPNVFQCLSGERHKNTQKVSTEKLILLLITQLKKIKRLLQGISDYYWFYLNEIKSGKYLGEPYR